MKKKLLSLLLVGLLFFSLMGCDEISSLLNKVQTGASFYSEYTEYSEVFENATEIIVDTETSITVGDTNLPVVPENIQNELYVMVDLNNQLTYADVTLNDLTEEAVYERSSNVVYQIDGLVVTPLIPVDGDTVFDANMDASNILKEDFDAQSITGENLSEEGVYSFDINLNDAVNLEELSEFLNDVTPEGLDVPTLNDAIAHIEISFNQNAVEEETEYVIELNISVDDFRVDFDEETYMVFSIVNHSILTVPAAWEFPQIFTDAYQFVAPLDVNLAKRPYGVDDVINYPVVANYDGYALLDLAVGDYEVASANLADFSYQIFDFEMNEIIVTDGVFNIVADGNYYILIKPVSDFQADIVIVAVVPE